MKLYAFLSPDTPGLEAPERLRTLRLAIDPATAARVALGPSPAANPTLVTVDIDEDDPAELEPLRCDNDLLFNQTWTPLHHRIETMSRLGHELDPHAVHEAWLPLDETSWRVSLLAAGTCIALGGHPEWILTRSTHSYGPGDLGALAEDGSVPGS